jgi:hypothetical protein
MSLLAADFASDNNVFVCLDLGGRDKSPSMELLQSCNVISPNEVIFLANLDKNLSMN